MRRSDHHIGRILDIDEFHVRLERQNINIEQIVVAEDILAMQQMDASSFRVDVVAGTHDMLDGGTRTILDVDLDGIDPRVGKVRQHEIDDSVSAQNRSSRNRTEILDSLDMHI